MEEHKSDHTARTEEYLRAHTLRELKPLSAPVPVVDYDSQWPGIFRQECEKIRKALEDCGLCVEHVGSTSVPGLPAKPIIDIVLVVADSSDERQYLKALESAGYELRIREPGWYEHRMFKDLESRVNLHVFSAGCPEVDRMLTFRNWLRVSDADRELYAQLKRTLAQHEWKYMQNYADAKTAVIGEIMRRAQQERNL